MESKPKRLLALMISLFTALMCFVPATVCAVGNKGASGMSWSIRSVTAAPGADVCVNVAVKNPVALRYVKNVTVISDSRLQPIGMTEHSDTLNANFTYKITGTQINFSMSSASPKLCTNGSIIFSIYYHVSEGARDNDSYKIEWVASNCYAETPSGAEYKISNFGSGSVNVSSSVPIGTTYIPQQPIETTTAAQPVTTTTAAEIVTTTSSSVVTQPQPQAELIVDTPASSELVEGNTVSLNVRSSTGAPVSGIWSESSDWSAVTPSGTNVKLNKSGTYYVTVHGSINGVQASKRVAITVQPKPTTTSAVVTQPVTTTSSEIVTEPITTTQQVKLIVDQPLSDQLYVGNKVALNIRSSNGAEIDSKIITASDSSAITAESNVITLHKAGTYTVNVKASIGGKVYNESIALTIIEKNVPTTQPVTEPVTDPVTEPVSTESVTTTEPITTEEPVTTTGKVERKPYELGDTDGDKRYTVSDATKVLRHVSYLANPNAGIEPTLTTEESLNAADANFDRRWTVVDATRILRFVSYLNRYRDAANRITDMKKWIEAGLPN